MESCRTRRLLLLVGRVVFEDWFIKKNSKIKKEAKNREKQLKSFKGREFIKNLIKS